MKKRILLLSFLFCVVMPLNAKIFYEVYGGYNPLSMKDYNDSVDQETSYLNAIGVVSHLNKIESAGFAGLVGGGTFSNDMGLWGMYLKTDYLFVSDNNSPIEYPGGEINMKIELSMDYIGLGVRKYFNTEIKNNQLNPYLGIDGGIAYSVGSLTSETIYNINGEVVASGLVGLSGAFFGMNAEVGCDYWFIDQFGLFARGGYRYAKGQFTGNMQYYNFVQDVDCSGGYILAGITFNFVNSKEPEKKNVIEEKTDDVALPTSDLKELVRGGDVEYNNKRYEIALLYYEDARKLNETAIINKKIGNCQYYLGNKSEAIKAYNKALELNPDDTKLKEWVENNK
jgi:tetratricopeptide (TPR) repeat protein